MHEEPLALTLRASLPLGWQAPSTDLAQETNPRVLAGLEALEGPPPTAAEAEAWWQRLEAKTDLLLAHAVLARVVYPDMPVQAVELAAHGLRWQGPALSGHYECWLALSPLAPPLILPIEADGLHGRFVGLDAKLQEALERLIFRRHRRELKRRKDRSSATE